MAIVKIVTEKYYQLSDVQRLINYATNESKTYGLFGGVGINPNDPDKMLCQMLTVKKGYKKEYGNRQLRHIVVSFDKEERITPQTAYYIAYEIAGFYGDEYQVCFGVHQDTDILHIHFVQNTVNYVTGKMYSSGIRELDNLKEYVEQIISRYMDRRGSRKGFLQFGLDMERGMDMNERGDDTEKSTKR